MRGDWRVLGAAIALASPPAGDGVAAKPMESGRANTSQHIMLLSTGKP